MHLAGIFLRPVFRRQLVPAMHQFMNGHTRLEHVHIRADMVQPVIHRRDHGSGRLAIADPPGAADIYADAIGADQVGIEGQDFVVVDDPWSAFLKPRVGPWARRQQARFDPFAATPDVGFVQFSPDIVLGYFSAWDLSSREMFHLGHRGLAGVVRAAHRQDLVRALDRPGAFGDFFAFHHLKPDPFKGAQPVHQDLVHTDAAVRAGMGAHHLIDLRGKAPRLLRRFVTRGEIEERGAMADLLDQRVEADQKRRVLVFPDNHVPVGADHAGAKRVVAVPKLHVRGVGRVADVERVEHQEPAIVARLKRLDQPLQPVFAHPFQVGQGQTRRRPFCKGQPRRSNLDPVRIIGGAVAQRFAARGIDLASLRVVFHHCPPRCPRLRSV